MCRFHLYVVAYPSRPLLTVCEKGTSRAPKDHKASLVMLDTYGSSRIDRGLEQETREAAGQPTVGSWRFPPAEGLSYA